MGDAGKKKKEYNLKKEGNMRRLLVLTLSLLFWNAGLAMAGLQGDSCCASKKGSIQVKKATSAGAVKPKAFPTRNFQPSKRSY